MTQGSTTNPCQRAATTDLLKSPGLDNGFKFSVKDSILQLTSPSKRSLAVYEDDHNSDEENVKPTVAQSAKRSKLEGVPCEYQKPLFSITVDKTSTSQHILAPAVKRKHGPEEVPAPIITPYSAPAGREIKPLKHKRVGLLSIKRPSLSPYKRIDPPARIPKKSSGGLPFSIDAAISGTVGPQMAQTKVPKLSKAMPNAWFFDIYEDTSDEEATIIMHHSCTTLDLSSDDEEGPAAKRTKLDKENIAPADYVAAHVNANISPRSRKAHADAMTDEGDRSPLSDLAPEEYFANGLDKNSVAVIAAEPGDTDEQPEQLRDEHASALVEERIDTATEQEKMPQQDEFKFTAEPMLAPREVPITKGLTFTIVEDVDAAES